MKRGRPVAASSTRAAASLASEPEWPYQTRRSASPGIVSSSASARAAAGSFGYMSRLAPAMSAIALVTASITAGWP